MKKFNIATIIMLLAVYISVVQAQTQAETGTITVKITQIDVRQSGKVKIGIYNSNSFPIIGKEVAGVDLEVKKSTIRYTFKDIPVGRYGIAVFQDENIDNKLNKNLFGAPKESYGFSKNKYGMFGPPDFDDVSFTLKSKEEMSLTINLE